jgi:hypothetical protein
MPPINKSASTQIKQGWIQCGRFVGAKVADVQPLAFEARDIDVPQWHSIFASVYREFRKQFDIATVSAGEQSGVTAIVWYLSRKSLSSQ